MKRIALLLAVGMIVSSTTGCGLFRRTRNLFNRGSFCGVSAPATTPTAGPVFAGPAQVIVPAPAPCVVPCEPCCPQVCDPCCDPCGPALTSYPTSQPYYDPGCDGCGTMGPMMGTPTDMGMMNGAVPTYNDPGPVPSGP